MGGLVSIFPTEQYIAILAMIIACLLPYLYSWLARVMGGFDFKKDNYEPRQFLANMTGPSARLQAAHINSLESLPIFLASVMMAMYCFVPQAVVNMMACLYVLLRIIYGIAYAYNLALFRSIIWGLSFVICLQLFYFAAKMLW